jgi:hypothetical protein
MVSHHVTAFWSFRKFASGAPGLCVQIEITGFETRLVAHYA